MMESKKRIASCPGSLRRYASSITFLYNLVSATCAVMILEFIQCGEYSERSDWCFIRSIRYRVHVKEDPFSLFHP